MTQMRAMLAGGAHSAIRPLDSGPGLWPGALARDVAHNGSRGRPERSRGTTQWSPGLARVAPLAVIGMVIGLWWPARVGAQEHPAPQPAAVVGRPAPEFSLPESTERVRSLSEFRGRFVVLEWFNPDCPFVRKHYGSGAMPSLQRRYTQLGAAWLTIDSSAPGKQGHLSPEAARTVWQQYQMASTALLLDPDGAVGRRYGAKTTPHMFIVDPEGTLRYAGAIDDIPSADPADLRRATNYIQQALDAAMAGRPVPIPETKPYGCSVKYASVGSGTGSDPKLSWP